MPTKTAIAIMLSFAAMVTFVGVGFAGAQVYTPLVNIPGLPPNTAVDLSMYVVGLYDFLLSVVGIVAVLMLIIGGMRYITSAGNQAAVSDAKDIITNALAGLLLAILSWVIVAEINPDVLYIKKPGAGFSSADNVDWAKCGTYDTAATTCICKDTTDISAATITNQTDCNEECRLQGYCFSCVSEFDLASGDCTCIDGTVLIPVFATEAICDANCSIFNCDFSNPYPCLETGISYPNSPDLEGKCHCIDSNKISPTAGQTCQEACKSANCLVADFRVGHYQIISGPPVEEYCIYNSPKEAPLVVNDDGAGIQIRLCGYNTISGNKNNGWQIDYEADGVWDGLLPATNDPIWSTFGGYAAFAVQPTCESANGGEFLLCPFAIQATDVLGNTSEDVLWIKILSP